MSTFFRRLQLDLATPGGANKWLPVLIALLVIIAPIALLGNAFADIVISICAIAFIISSLIDRNLTWLKEPWIVLACILWIYLTLRGFASVDPERSGLKGLSWIRFIVFGAAVQFALTRSNTVRRALLYSIIVMTTFGSADALFQYFIGYDIFGRPILLITSDNVTGTSPMSYRLTGPLQNPAIGMLLLYAGLPGLIFFMMYVTRGAVASYRLFCVIGLISAALAVVLSGERLTLLMIFPITAVVAIAVFQVRVLKLFVGMILAVATVGLVVFSAPDSRKRHLSTVVELMEPTHSIYGRTMLSGYEVFTKNPWFGVGLKNFKSECEVFTTRKVGDACKLIHPHQVWLQIASETGLIGVFGFLGLFALALTPSLRMIVQWRIDPLLAGTTIAVLFRLLPLTPSGNFFSNWRECFFWLMFGTAAAVARAQKLGKKVQLP